VRVEPKAIGVAAITHNAYAARSMPFVFEWQTDLFIWIAICQAYP